MEPKKGNHSQIGKERRGPGGKRGRDGRVKGRKDYEKTRANKGKEGEISP